LTSGSEQRGQRACVCRKLRFGNIGDEGRAAFSASSRLFGLKSEVNRFKTKNISAIIAADVRRFGHPIKRTRFSVHTLINSYRIEIAAVELNIAEIVGI
jgi:hypothetical protein